MMRAAAILIMMLPFVVPGHRAWAQDSAGPSDAMPIRVATFNVEDVSTSDLLVNDQPRVQRLAEIIQRLRPTVLLVNEIAFDQHGVPGVPTDEPEGSNGQRFADHYLEISQGEGLEPIRYRAVMLPTNTGRASGFDLDNSDQATTTYPMPARSSPNGDAPPQTDDGRAYGNDCWGFGTYPGQYGMALLVDVRLDVLDEEIRSFRLLPWSAMPDARRPMNDDGTPWYDDEEWAAMRLSSKSHWDVPVRLPNGAVVHFLCSHPTPPAFDGPEGRNKARNHDEIRFWDDYLDNRGWIADDNAQPGGIQRGERFVILGDLNADPDKGSDVGDPIGRLTRHPRLQSIEPPTHEPPVEDLDPTDTARFGLRVDYVLPSRGLQVLRSGVWTLEPAPPGRQHRVPERPLPGLGRAVRCPAGERGGRQLRGGLFAATPQRFLCHRIERSPSSGARVADDPHRASGRSGGDGRAPGARHQLRCAL